MLKMWNAILGHHTGELKYALMALLTNPSGRENSSQVWKSV